MELIQNKKEPVAGFIQKKRELPEFLLTKRILKIRAFRHSGTYYFRTREITDMLGILQPFSMTDWCRKKFGNDHILSDKDTEAFRLPEDNPGTTFIAACDALRYIEHLKNSKKNKADTKLIQTLYEEMETYCKLQR